ncbi:MAG: hypothetical protein ACYC6X_01750 [Minisyncoccota bacterium]
MNLNIVLFTLLAVLVAPAVYAGQECHTLDGVQYCKPGEPKDCINLNGQRLCKQISGSATAQNQDTSVSWCTQNGGIGQWIGTRYACQFPQAQAQYPISVQAQIWGSGYSGYNNGISGNISIGNGPYYQYQRW